MGWALASPEEIKLNNYPESYHFITDFFSEHIPPEQVCLQLVQFSGLGGSTFPSIGHRPEVQNVSLLHLGRGDPSMLE